MSSLPPRPPSSIPPRLSPLPPPPTRSSLPPIPPRLSLAAVPVSGRTPHPPKLPSSPPESLVPADAKPSLVPADAKPSLVPADAKAVTQTAIDEAIAPLQHTIETLERRLESLERRAIATAAAPRAQEPVPERVPQISLAAPSPPIDLDVRLDGDNRKRKVAALLAIVVMLVFLTLFGSLALANS
jgi:hypothetical protein